MEFVCELLGVRDPNALNRGLRPFDRRKLEAALKGVNVEVTHRKSSRQVCYAVLWLFGTPAAAAGCWRSVLVLSS